MPVRVAFIIRAVLVTSSGLLFWCATGFSSEFVTLGEEKLMQGKLNQAEDYLLRALEENPADCRALGSLGRVYFHQGMYEEAEENLLLSMARQPVEEWLKCWNNVYLGRISIINGAFEDAFLSFNEASDRQATANCIRESEKYLAYLDILEYSKEALTDHVETERYVIHYAGEDIPLEKVSALPELVDRYYDKTEHLLGISFENDPIHIHLYPPAYQYKLWTARELVAAGLSESEIHVFHRNTLDDGHLEHEMVHVMTGPILEGHTPIALLNEGMAEFVVGDLWGLSVDAWVKGIIRNGCFVPISILADSSAFRAINPILSYTQAGSFVKFLVEEFGTKRLFDVAAGESSWEDSYELSLSELEELWLANLDSLSITPVETDLLNYRLSLGDRYRTAGFSSEGLPWVGVTYEAMGEVLVITDVAPNGPAQKAGLRVGDLIRKVDGTSVNAGNRWLPAATVHRKEIGEVVYLDIERDSMEKSFRIILDTELNPQKR